MEIGDEIWVINTQRVRQTTINKIIIDPYGGTIYVTPNMGVYMIEEIGGTKKELMEKFFGEIGNPYRHYLV